MLDEVISGRVSLASVCSDPVLRAAVSRLNSYADRLHFVEASPSSTSVEGLEKTVAKLREGPTTLFIDYLQKVFVKDANKSYSEHVGLITAGLKEMSIQRSISVVAIAAIGDHGLYKRRTHLPDLDAAVAVGYDADVIIMLNDKRPIVSSHNLSYTTDQEDRFRQRIVFTVAKNRGGIAPIDLEFTKDFEHFRFDPEGSFVTEQLIEDREHDDLRS